MSFMKKSTLFLLCSTMLLLGTVAGFFLAPIKQGLSIASNNGNTYGGCNSGKTEDDADAYDDGNDIPF